jgi:copper resistance protein D
VVHSALDQFSPIGTLAVTALIVTGIFNSVAVIGIPDLSQFASSDYVRLLAIKFLLFAAMLVLAAFNR